MLNLITCIDAYVPNGLFPFSSVTLYQYYHGAICICAAWPTVHIWCLLFTTAAAFVIFYCLHALRSQALISARMFQGLHLQIWVRSGFFKWDNCKLFCICRAPATCIRRGWSNFWLLFRFKFAAFPVV